MLRSCELLPSGQVNFFWLNSDELLPSGQVNFVLYVKVTWTFAITSGKILLCMIRSHEPLASGKTSLLCMLRSHERLSSGQVNFVMFNIHKNVLLSDATWSYRQCQNPAFNSPWFSGVRDGNGCESSIHLFSYIFCYHWFFML